MGKKILGTLAGVVVAFGLVALIEQIGHMVYPVPEGLDWADKEQLKSYIDTLPFGAFLFVLAAWSIGTFGGSWLASYIGKDNRLAYIVGGFVFAATAVNFIMIPHPVWFSITAVVLIISATMAGKCASTKKVIESDN